MFWSVLILSSIFNIHQANLSRQKSSISHEIYKRSEDSCAGQKVEKCQELKSEELKQCKICGLINGRPGAHLIIEGKEVKPPNLYPWMVAVMHEKQKQCGGAILKENYILTASHCITKHSTLSSQAKMESLPVYNPDEIEIGFLSDRNEIKIGPPIEKIIPHPDFLQSNMEHDIALIKLKENIICDTYKNPICLPSSELNITENDSIIITGWGANVEGKPPNEYPKALQQGRVEIVNSSECEEAVPRGLIDVAYCLKGLYKQRPCFGDSGGSMFIEHKNFFVSMGVASMQTSKYCSEGKPFLYTSVAKHVDWIKEVIGESSKEESLLHTQRCNSFRKFIRVQRQ